MSVVELGSFIEIGMCFPYLTTKKYQTKGGYVDLNLNTKGMELFDRLKILSPKIQRHHIFEICEKNL